MSDPYRTNDDIGLRQAVLVLVNQIWPRYKGDLTDAVRAITALQGSSHMSPFVRQIYEDVRAQLEEGR